MSASKVGRTVTGSSCLVRRGRAPGGKRRIGIHIPLLTRVALVSVPRAPHSNTSTSSRRVVIDAAV